MAPPALHRPCLRIASRQLRRPALALKARNLHKASCSAKPPARIVSVSASAPSSNALASRQLHTSPPLAAANPANLQNATFIRESCQSLFKECARQADYIIPQAFTSKDDIPTTESGEHIGEGTGWWYESLHLLPTFNTWAQVTFLHMYMLTARLRMFPPESAGLWLQQLHDAFFYEAEHRMTIFHQLSSRGVRNKYLKDLYNQWRGVQAAYDEGLIKGDAILATAIWRNIFAAKDDVDWEDVAMVVSFMRRGLRGLEKADDGQIAASMVRFGSPLSERAIVAQPSRGLARGFSEQEIEEADRLLADVRKTGK